MMSTRDLVLTALFAAIIVALGLLPPISLGFIPVPITAQSLGVMMAGVVLGARRGAIAVLIVLVLVAIGLPVLSGGRGGLAIFASPTAGFLIGWIFAAFVTGWLSERLVNHQQSGLVQTVSFFLTAMVFQNYALFPHLTVAENIAYPLACQKLPRTERKARVEEMLSLVRLKDYGNRLPRELSGGQQQRVAVARAIAGRPSLLLLDEPFGALDRALRFDLQVELLHLQKTLGITTLIVTHDQEEAQSLANRLVLMNKGNVEQIDTPMTVYDRPKTLFVNSFIGQANLLNGTVLRLDADGTLIGLADDRTLLLPRRLNFTLGSKVTITFRPEEVRLSTQPSESTLPVRMSLAI